MKFVCSTNTAVQTNSLIKLVYFPPHGFISGSDPRVQQPRISKYNMYERLCTVIDDMHKFI